MLEHHTHFLGVGNIVFELIALSGIHSVAHNRLRNVSIQRHVEAIHSDCQCL